MPVSPTPGRSEALPRRRIQRVLEGTAGPRMPRACRAAAPGAACVSRRALGRRTAAAAFRKPIGPLPPRDGLRWHRSPEGAVVEVREDGGRVAGVHLCTGGAALDLLRDAATAAVWGPPLRRRRPRKLRWTRAGRTAFGSCLPTCPQGRRRIRFSVADPDDGTDTAFEPASPGLAPPRGRRQGPPWRRCVDAPTRVSNDHLGEVGMRVYAWRLCRGAGRGPRRLASLDALSTRTAVGIDTVVQR